jgi:peptidoglycan hydrolase CwlO-like protein
MHEAMIVDLKQFIAGAITQQTSDIRQDIQRLDKRVGRLETKVGGLEAKMGSLETKVDDGFSAIADILDEMNARHGAAKAQINSAK